MSDLTFNMPIIFTPADYSTRPLDTIYCNFIDAFPVVRYCSENNKHLIHFSTCEVYGKMIGSFLPKNHPLGKVASGGIGSGIGNNIGDDSNVNGVKNYVGGDSNVAVQSKLKNVSYGDISDNAKCKLLHWSVDGVVAEGRIASTDPKAKVHYVLLGGSCWKVWIDRVFVDKVDLIRPNKEMLFLEDAIGSTVA